MTWAVLLTGQLLVSISHAADEQIWATLDLSKPHSETLFYKIDIQPKVQYQGDPRWWSLQAMPILERYISPWFTLLGEVRLAYTHQDNQVDTYQVTPRIGFKVHLFEYARDMIKPERTPLKRLGFGNLTRLEYKNKFFSNDEPTDHDWRLRNRLGAQFPINNKHITDPHTLYVGADGEIFIDLSADPEVLLNKIRGRMHLGYRLDYTWRFEVVFIRDWNRDTRDDPFAIQTNAWNFSVLRFF